MAEKRMSATPTCQRCERPETQDARALYFVPSTGEYACMDCVTVGEVFDPPTCRDCGGPVSGLAKICNRCEPVVRRRRIERELARVERARQREAQYEQRPVDTFLDDVLKDA